MVPVDVALPLKKTVPVTVDYTGQTVGSETVDVRARVEGFLESIHFTEGTFVKKGDRLYEIDKDRMQQIVEQAEGELNVAKANEEKSIADVNRNRPLVEKNAISREEYETSVSAPKAAHAKVEAAAAAVQRAKINMSYASVKAPIAGLVGKTEVDLGNLVGRGEPTLLTTISKIDPIYAEVRISEIDVFKYRKDREARGGKPSRARAVPLRRQQAPAPGRDRGRRPQRRHEDRHAAGAGLVPEPRHSIRPGQFARVQAVREIKKDALLVPQGAVAEMQGTYQLYVVERGRRREAAVGPGRTAGRPAVGDRGGHRPRGPRGRRGAAEAARSGTRTKPRMRTIGEDGKLAPLQATRRRRRRREALTHGRVLHPAADVAIVISRS